MHDPFEGFTRDALAFDGMCGHPWGMFYPLTAKKVKRAVILEKKSWHKSCGRRMERFYRLCRAGVFLPVRPPWSPRQGGNRGGIRAGVPAEAGGP